MDWQQGDIVSLSQARALGAADQHTNDETRFVVVSHSCDLAAAQDVEPYIELLPAGTGSCREQKYANGHSIRRLGLPANGQNEENWLIVSIQGKQYVDKLALFEHKPNKEGFVIPAGKRAILRRWLVQRYSRSAFPDMFVCRLKQMGVEKGMEKWAKRYSHTVIGIYFDLDDDSEHDDLNRPYELGISLVYGTDNDAYMGQAKQAAKDLSRIFEQRCRYNEQWRGIELLYCDAIADTAFPLRAVMQFRRWRFEHRSIAGEPVDTSDQ